MSEGGADPGRREATGAGRAVPSEPWAPSEGGADPGPRGPEGAIRGVPGEQSGAASPRRRSARRLVTLVLAGLAGAGCCAGAAALTWWTRRFHDPLAGPITVSVTGSTLLGGLVPVALVALAGLGAAFATRGVLRRVVGALVALAGVLVAVRSALTIGSAPIDQLAAKLTRPATATGPAELNVAGPLLALLGGLLVVLAGVLVATGADRSRRMGSAYDAPARRREQALARARARAAAPGAEDVDPGDLWRAMDAGADPTEQPGPAPAAPGPEPLSGPDTMGAPDGPDLADPDRTDRPGHRGSDPTCQAPDEETTG